MWHRDVTLKPQIAADGTVLEALPADREFRRDRPRPDLEPGGPSMWSIYLDDFSDIVFAAWDVALALSGQTSESQDKLRRLYAFHCLPTNSGKALQSAISAERLGYSLDGFSGWFGILNVRAAKILTLALEVLRMTRVPVLALQVHLGQTGHAL